uniref:SREBP regulating gene protein n=1 Tax=Ornithorhynchus anatinus TaxID=9258 RepID=A0A6I8NZQ6_ORNAN
MRRPSPRFALSPSFLSVEGMNVPSQRLGRCSAQSKRSINAIEGMNAHSKRSVQCSAPSKRSVNTNERTDGWMDGWMETSPASRRRSVHSTDGLLRVHGAPLPRSAAPRREAPSTVRRRSVRPEENLPLPLPPPTSGALPFTWPAKPALAAGGLTSVRANRRRPPPAHVTARPLRRAGQWGGSRGGGARPRGGASGRACAPPAAGPAGEGRGGGGGDGAGGGAAVAAAAAEALGAGAALRPLPRLLPQQHLQTGHVCERKHLLGNGCCDSEASGTRLFSCEGCLSHGCCSVYEHCVSCCLQPGKQVLLERFLSRAAAAFQNLFTAVEDLFELCLARCRTSSQSVQHENTYRDPVAKFCYGEQPPQLLPS